jgi:hypothetical protein
VLGIPIIDLPTLGSLRAYSVRSDADCCFQFIDERIQQCETLHKTYAQIASAVLPKRILSIGSIDAKVIKLVENSCIKARYAALSHCWGGHQPLTTTHATLMQRKHCVYWDDMPRAFQDAITVARRLQIAWIWIDSLCIIQDDKEDWQTESAKMCDYYENAYITIAASSSPNGMVPFLKERESSWWPINFDFQNCDGTVSTVCARRYSRDNDLEALGPISSRAWVYQENVLSTRVLHYAESELIWECKSEMCSEQCEIQERGDSLGLTRKLLDCGEDPYGCWYSLVESYTKRKLTMDSDKLPALSGVASRIHRIVDSQYLAGLWEKILPIDLAWYSSDDQWPLALPETYRAPSWSWASIEGTIQHFVDAARQPFHSLISTIDEGCTVLGLNPFGEVSDGFLTLRGPLLQTTLSCENPNDWMTFDISLKEDIYTSLEGNSHESIEVDSDRIPSDSDDDWSLDPDDSLSSELNVDTFLVPDTALVECDALTEEGSVKKTVRRWRQGDILAPFNVSVFCLQLGHQYHQDSANGDSERYYAMVLGRSDSVPGTYTRLGIFHRDVDVEEKHCFEGMEMTTVKII